MAGVLDRLGRARKRPVEMRRQGPVSRSADLHNLQLQAAKEILAEVFGVTLAEVEVMIRLRSEERTLWPERFWLEE